MRTNLRKATSTILTTAVLTAAVIGSSASITALAATEPAGETERSAYGYLSGQQQNAARHGLFEAVPDFLTDEEREAYFAEHGIGQGGLYSAMPHLDAEALVASGLIDQAAADAIAAYASQKHEQIHARYEGTSAMTFEQLHALYESLEADSFAGDTADELVNAGLLTQEQAAALR